jgi:glycosyltransferase involved in cell wall biosynthesis
MNHKRVAIFTLSGYDVITSPLINTANYLAALGCAVDIFTRNQTQFRDPNFRYISIRYLAVTIPDSPVIRRIGRFFLLKHVWNELRLNQYDFTIGFDPRAFQHAWLLARLKKIPAVYHSLEFYPEKTLKQKIRRSVENIFLRKADWIITQDALRADWLSRKLHFPHHRISVISNTSFGDHLPQKSSYFRNKFHIPDAKKIVLAIGSLIKEHMILEIAKSVEGWADEFVLVVHGWFPDEKYEGDIRECVDRWPHRIFISTEFLPIERKYEAFQSADIGLVAFAPDNENNLLVGAAAGKLFEFARCGVPVVVNDLPGMRTLVGGLCGEICGEWLDSIADTIQIINNNYDAYRKGCEIFYSRHNFSSMYGNFLSNFSADVQNKL